MYLDYLRAIIPGDTEGAKWTIVQAWLHRAVLNLGIAIPSSVSNPLLQDILPGDTEGTKWAKLGAWTEILANNISGGGGGGVTITPVTVAGSSTLGANTFTTVNAAGATNQALPAAPANGTVCIVKSIGAGIATVTSGAANIFGGTAVSSYAVGANGSGATFTWDGTYWEVT